MRCCFLVLQGGLGPRGDKGFPGLAGQQVITMYLSGIFILAVLHDQASVTRWLLDALRKPSSGIS